MHGGTESEGLHGAAVRRAKRRQLVVVGERLRRAAHRDRCLGGEAVRACAADLVVGGTLLTLGEIAGAPGRGAGRPDAVGDARTNIHIIRPLHVYRLVRR